MDWYLQALALVMVAIVLGLLAGSHHKLLLSIAACALVCFTAVRYLEPVMDLLERLRELSGVSGEMLSILLKAAGIGLLSELAALICADAGDQALGKAVGILTNAAIIWISLPMLEELLELLQEVLGRF